MNEERPRSNEEPLLRVFDHRSKMLAEVIDRHHQVIIPPPLQEALAGICASDAWPLESPQWWICRADAAHRALVACNDLDRFRRWMHTRASLVQLALIDAALSRTYVRALRAAPGDAWYDWFAPQVLAADAPLRTAALSLES